MGFQIGDKVIFRNYNSFYVAEFDGQEGKIIKTAYKGNFPYLVVFKNKAKRWCKTEELELLA